MQSIRLLAAAAALAGLTSAQTSARYITPRGAEFFEGNSASDIMLGNWNPNTRTQQIDNNLVGTGFPLIRLIGWRRNGTGGVGAAKSTDVTVIMSHADYNTVTNTFANNYKDPPVTVFTRKTVNLPDWNTATTLVPAPFDVVLPLDVPFLYNNTDALLFDVLNENNPLGIYTQDWVSSTTHQYGAYPVDTGAGCTTANGSFVHRCAIRANATTLDVGFRIEGAPSSSALLVMIGASDPNLPVPGLCAPLHALPTLFLSLGAASATGAMNTTFPISTPWSTSYVGVTLFTQALATDLSQPVYPVVVSNGLSSAAPTGNATGTVNINIKRIYHTSSTTAVTGTGPAVSAVPTLFAY